MTDSAGKVLITPDPRHPGWYLAHGRNLLAHAGRIPTVAAEQDGIAYHQDYAGEVRAALTTNGYRLTDAQPRTPDATPTPLRHGGWNHRVYVSDADDLTILPDNSPSGHWQDESSSCSRCNPAHAQASTQVRVDAMTTIRAALATIAARTAPDPGAGLADMTSHPCHDVRMIGARPAASGTLTPAPGRATPPTGTPPP